MSTDDPALNHAELPLACSLQAREGTERLARWRTLFAMSAPTVRRTPDLIAVRVADSPGVAAELDALVAKERECCSFVRWHVVHDAGWHELRIQGTAEGLTAVGALFAGE